MNPNMPQEPVVTTIGLIKAEDGYRTVVLETKGDRVVKRTVSESDAKGICLEDLKISFVRLFVDKDIS